MGDTRSLDSSSYSIILFEVKVFHFGAYPLIRHRFWVLRGQCSPDTEVMSRAPRLLCDSKASSPFEGPIIV